VNDGEFYVVLVVAEEPEREVSGRIGEDGLKGGGC
jgi:hypothetical protein